MMKLRKLYDDTFLLSVYTIGTCKDKELRLPFEKFICIPSFLQHCIVFTVISKFD